MTSFGSDLILARLQGLHPKAIDLSLARLERLLERLGHPERQTAPVVHIAGTNGKGSTLAMLDAMLQAAGRRVQRYISPHLVHFNERILFDGEPIDERTLAEALDHCEQVNGGAPITFFEITTAAAFVAFARRPADLLLLETGLGGRLDATNVVPKPRLTAITPVSLDHEAYLGDRIGLIAAEKAGILKPGVPCILGPQPAEALAVIEARAAALAVPLTVHGRDWQARPTAQGRLLVTVGNAELDLPLPSLRGRHQIDNAGLAVVCARALGELAPSPAALAKGLRRACWLARLQRLRAGPLVERLPRGWQLWLDGGHNPAAGEALAASLADDDPRPWHLIVGMLTTKDEAAFLRHLQPLAQTVQTVPVPDEPASRDPAEAARQAQALGMAASPAADVGAALEAILAKAQGPARILICGSLYLAGHVLRDSS